MGLTPRFLREETRARDRMINNIIKRSGRGGTDAEQLTINEVLIANRYAASLPGRQSPQLDPLSKELIGTELTPEMIDLNMRWIDFLALTTEARKFVSDRPERERLLQIELANENMRQLAEVERIERSRLQAIIDEQIARDVTNIQDYQRRLQLASSGTA